MSAFAGHSSLRQRKIWTEIPDCHTFATKAPNHAIALVFSRPSDLISHREIIFTLVLPLSHPSRGWETGLISSIHSSWESWWPRHSQTAKESVLQCHCHVQQTKLGCPHWENDPVSHQLVVPQIKPPEREKGERQKDSYWLHCCWETPLHFSTLRTEKRVSWGWTNLKHWLSEVWANTSAWFF